ncbi:MAG: MFS transporter, partial [Bacteroidetes bacterium]|nr:MFS transporter [Bacteroidota bacterium]
LSDEKGVRLPFVKLGYTLSNIAKPMMAAFTFPVWIYLARTIDRLGKGVRTAARDALLSQEATRETKGRVFGFHRGMDTLGATIGPILALLFLFYFPGRYRSIFFLAFIPGIISILLIFLVKEKKQQTEKIERGGFFSFFNYWKVSSPEYKRLVTGLLIFALFNSSDIFLLLKTKEITGSDTTTIAAYIFYNLVYAVASYPLGVLADKFSLRNIFMTGLLMFAIVYTGFSFSSSVPVIFILYFIYGLYAAATEGITKAWITNIAHQSNTATAVGFYTGCQSFCSLLASIIAGLLWSNFNSMITFLTTAVITVIVLFYFIFSQPLKKNFSA